MKTNKTLLMIIVVLLVCILGVLVYQAQRPQTTGEKIEDAVNSAADDIGNAIEDIGKDIQKNTR